MALLQEIEPPSSNKTFEGLTKNIIDTSIFKRIKSILNKNGFSLFAIWKKIISLPKNLVELIIKSELTGKYLPHTAICFLGLLVVISNFSQAAKAKQFQESLLNIEPDTEFAIVSSIDRFTPVTSNDAILVSKKEEAKSIANGFAYAATSVDTKITARVEALPDNASDSVFYVIRQGDTLTGLGMKFGVKIATLKYINDISSADLIKPGVRIKIPPRGYEVSTTLIAQKEKANQAKIALASRNTVTRGTSTARTTTQKTYYGTINGVRYVQKSYGQCYTYVTSLGYNVGGHYLAKWIPTNSSTPRVGGLVVTYESWAGHVAVVTAVNGDGTFDIRERNYTPGWITERTLRADDGDIKGFVN